MFSDIVAFTQLGMTGPPYFGNEDFTSGNTPVDLSPTSVAMPTYNGAIDESFGCAVSTKCLADGTPTGELTADKQPAGNLAYIMHA